MNSFIHWWQHLSWSHAALCFMALGAGTSTTWIMFKDWANGGPDYDSRD